MLFLLSVPTCLNFLYQIYYILWNQYIAGVGTVTPEAPASSLKAPLMDSSRTGAQLGANTASSPRAAFQCLLAPLFTHTHSPSIQAFNQLGLDLRAQGSSPCRYLGVQQHILFFECFATEENKP